MGHETHNFENNVCRECGINKNDYFTQKAISTTHQDEALSFIEEITSAECLEKVILNPNTRHSVCLRCVGKIANLKSDEILKRISENVQIDYEVREKAKGCISNEEVRKQVNVAKDIRYDSSYNTEIKRGL